jgi:hypothetical protein
VRLCLDEHYSPQIAAGLRDLGREVASVKERPELESLGDSELLAVMHSERRAVLTENVQDFAPIIRQIAAEGRDHFGIVYSSLSSMPRSRDTIGMFIDSLSELMERFPGDEDFLNRTEWLSPARSGR